MVKAASQSLGIKSMLSDFGLRSRIKLVTDASAAQGIAARRGLGQIKHIEVSQLWLQDRVNKGEIIVEKTGGKDNIADTLTKFMMSDSLQVHMMGAHLSPRMGRHELAPIVEDSIDDDVFHDLPSNDESSSEEDNLQTAV